jgi:heme/copper-type cytochrome/quinol oxidase subunit 4
VIIHLPPLFSILGVLFAALVAGALVGGALQVWAFMHMDSGPDWYWFLPVPCGVIAAVVTGYFCLKLI